MKVIAKIKTDFPTKFGLPRQSGLAEEIKGKIVFEKEYRNPDALRGLQDFSHLWIIWEFSESKREVWSPTVRPPLLGGNERKGVFATRSPFRPNPIGLSSVKIEKIENTKNEGPVIFVSGVDMMDNTPIYDIKPYLPYTDCKTDATGGFTDALKQRKLEVVFPENLKEKFDKSKQKEIIEALSGDPRPSYIDDENRVYGFLFYDSEIKFTVNGKQLTVVEVKNV